MDINQHSDSKVPEQIPLPLETIRQAYNELGHHIHIVLRTQLSDGARLNAAKRKCLRFLGVVEQVCQIYIFYYDVILSTDWKFE